MPDVKQLLERVVALIDRDLTQIEGMEGKLDRNASQDLVGYSRALETLSLAIDKKIDRAKSDLSKLSTEELLKVAAEVGIKVGP